LVEDPAILKGILTSPVNTTFVPSHGITFDIIAYPIGSSGVRPPPIICPPIHSVVKPGSLAKPVNRNVIVVLLPVKLTVNPS
jgi:hypothetical protein